MFALVLLKYICYLIITMHL